MSSALIRSELIARLAEALPEVPASQAKAVVKYLLDTLSDTLAAGERIEIRGFGSFSLHIRPAQVARNPRAGEPVAMGGKMPTPLQARRSPEKPGGPGMAAGM